MVITPTTQARAKARAARHKSRSRRASTSQSADGFLAFAASRGLAATRPILALADLIERSRREEVRAVVAMPPRHGKTQSILTAFAWLLAQDATRTHAYATYAAQLARSKSRTARRLATEAGVQLAGDSASLEEWRTTAGGGLLATGAGGPLTGQGITGLGVVDDPLKNRQEAESSLIRDRLWEWFTDVFYTRLEPGASALVVATRWHPADLSGRLIADGWELVNLPALDSDGAALWPEQYPVERLAEIRAQVGEYTWASLYQGKPRPKGGAVFADAHYYDALPEGGYREAHGFDAAYTAKTHADYSVTLTGRLYGDTLYLTNMIRAQLEPRQYAALLLAAGIRQVTWFRSGTEKGLEALLRELGLHVVALTATGDKFVRAQPAAAAWNAGRVLVPRNADWAGPLLDEVLSFTGTADAHDDIVDALAGLWAALNTSPQIFI